MSSMTSTRSSAQIMRWNSPIPYLFGGLALILAIIAIALVILACSYFYKKKQLSDSLDAKNPVAMDDAVILDDKPKIVVIMAGEDKPTYIAMPINITLPADNDSINPSLTRAAAADDQV